MATTHAVMAIAGCCFVLGESSWLVVLLAMLGSQIPDLDTTSSVVGRFGYPVAAWIEERYAHRTITHSLNFSLLLVAIAAVPWILLGYSWRYWLAVPLAHLLSCIGDTLTKTGVAWFWPNPARVVFTRNPNRRIETGTSTEYLLLVVLVAAALVVTDINTKGGLWLSVTQMLGTSSSVEAVVNNSGGTNHIWVDIEGVRASDRAPVNKRFFVIDQSGSSRFVVTDGEGIYETEEQIIPQKMKVETGEAATVREQGLSFEDEELLPELVTLYEANSAADVYLSGSLTIDAPEDIQAIAQPRELPTITKAGNTLTLNYAPLVKVGKLSTNQWATGQLTARIIYPQPNYEQY